MMRNANSISKVYSSYYQTTRRPRPRCLQRLPTRECSTVSSDGRRKKVVVLLGATGSGKTRLSVDLASRFNGEIINSDKTQLYRGLDITTNKIPLPQRGGVRHHLLGDFDPSRRELSASDYRSVASSVVSDISSRSKLPILAGGSNPFVYALLTNRFRPDSDFSLGSDCESTGIRYDCCFLWVHVAPAVLDAYLEKRVDDMMRSGMLGELARFFAAAGVDSGTRPAFRRAIGLPEFSEYFRRFPHSGGNNSERGTREQREMVEKAVREIKDNTCRLARVQMEKIQRLRDLSWNLRRIETTDVFRAVMSTNSDRSVADAVYQKQVLQPGLHMVEQFLQH